jgi:tetratricopeptide (TPR) repeat protein
VSSTPSSPAFDDRAWFRRFRFAPEDLDDVLAEVAELRVSLAGGPLAPAGELAVRLDLGSTLFPLGHEDEAEATLEPALALARELGDRGRLVAAQLHLATTRQYLGRPAEALRQFEDALELARATGARADEHYLLHHRGRCLAEVGDVAAARASFEQALGLRLALGQDWAVTSTRTALEELDSWCASRR